MISLFIDTSMMNVSISIVKDDKILSIIQEEIPNEHSKYATNYVKKVIDEAGIDANDVDNILVVNGPGSFTGVRVGVTVAKMIGWALKKDIIPLSSLELLATTEIDATNHIGVIDARRGYVFAGIYDSSLNRIMEDKYMPLADLEVYLSDGKLISYDKLDGVTEPVIDIAKIVEKHINDKPINAHALKPNYLKLTEAEEKKKESK